MFLAQPVQPASRIKGYEVYIRKTADNRFRKDGVVNSGSTNSYVLKGLKPGTPYEVKIRAFNARYVSSFSNVRAFSTITKPEGAFYYCLHVVSSRGCLVVVSSCCCVFVWVDFICVLLLCLLVGVSSCG